MPSPRVPIREEATKSIAKAFPVRFCRRNVNSTARQRDIVQQHLNNITIPGLSKAGDSEINPGHEVEDGLN